MNNNTDYTLNFKRDFFNFLFAQLEKEASEKVNTYESQHRDEENKVKSIVNDYLPLSTSRVSSRSQESEETKPKDGNTIRKHKHLHR